jgi:LAO/AO transport system kinase
MKKNISSSEYKEGIIAGDRMILSKAITLVESSLPYEKFEASELIDQILPYTGRSIRIGITGVPGVGKSTFIESFGLQLTSQGRKVAVLSIDPSSSRNKGSILGDKTRMGKLSIETNAFIRPSPSGNQLGGIAQKTRENILLCEAAGFDVILIETVGVGQSETAVKELCDFVLLLMLAGGGDELQGIKRGIMELADMVAINKVDGENVKAGNIAKKAYQQALHLFPPNDNKWVVPVATISSLDADGISIIWPIIQEFKKLTTSNGHFEKNRQEQNLSWFRTGIDQALSSHFLENESTQSKISDLEEAISTGKISVKSAVNSVMDGLRNSTQTGL